MSSEFAASLRRLKPEKRRQRLRPRAEAELNFLGHDFLGKDKTRPEKLLPDKLLYDTTVYIDILQNRFPQYGERLMRAAEGWHSPVTEAELAAACGLLDPAHPGTRQAVEAITQVIERRMPWRTITPDADIWRDAGILSGTLARLLGYGKDQRRRALNDALLFASARKYGCTVLTRNVADFDLLQQLDPSGRVLFYK